MKKYIFSGILWAIVQFGFSQTASIKGTISDTLNKQQLEHVVVNILFNKDSVLYKFTRSNEHGKFTFSNLNQGNYVLLVTYPGYADYYDTISLKENSEIDLGKIMLTTKVHLLADVTVRQKIAAVRMKGDTIVYKVDSFKVSDGATVEDLLKKFPGIQVDKNGNITAQGTKVEKVMVDGEEFFGDDPTVATKNLNAKMVNEVQVFDKKTDQATFTGIDDGQTTRTINLKLKDDAKKGWFGKIEASGGPQDVWNNSLMANSFKKKRKLSVFGIASSTGKTGLNWDERGKFGDGGNNEMQMTDDGGMYMTWSGGDNFDNSNYWGEGIPKSWSTGINYSNKYNSDKQSLNGSYRYSKIINNGGGSTLSQSILPDTLFFNSEKRDVYGNKDRHSMNGSYDWMIDSLFSVKVNIVATKGTVNTSSNYSSQALNAMNQFVNKSKRSTTSIGENHSFKSSILFKKRFKKIGRTISLNIDQSVNEFNSESTLYSLNDYYDKSSINFRSDTTDQKKNNGSNNNILNSKIAFTEALTKKITMELSYAFNINQYQNKVLSFDKSLPGKYDLLNTKYSNNYDFKVVNNRVGTVLKYSPKKILVSIGGDIAFADFTQKDLLKDSSIHYSFTNLFPKATFTYKFNPNKRINFNYNGSTQQHSIQQIQPLADNTNPLFVQIGNANLKQEFNHRFSINMNNYQVLKNRGYNVGFNYNIIDNYISSSQKTDSVGKNITQYINTDGNYNYRINIGYNSQISSIDAGIYSGLSSNVSNSINYVNGIKNETKNNNYSWYFNFYKSKEKVYDFSIWNEFSYNSSKSSIRPDIVTNYWTAEFNIDFTITIHKKWDFNNAIRSQIRQKTELFSGNNNVTVWNSHISKKILKNDKGQIRLSAFDILNQNRGYSRNISSTTLTENNYQQLSQYFLLGFIWNFSKGGAASKQ